MGAQRSAAIGAALAAVVVAGCGSTVAGSGPPPALHLVTTAGTGVDAAAVAPGAGSQGGGSTGGRYVLRADLPTAPDSAPVYRPDAAARAAVEKLAKAFDLADPVAAVEDGFRAGPLAVRTDGSWYFGSDCAPATVADCPIGYDVGTGTVSVGSAGGAGSGSGGGGSGSAGAAGASALAPADAGPDKPSTAPGSPPLPAVPPPDQPSAKVGPGPTYRPPPVASDEVAGKAAEAILAALGLPQATVSVSYGQVRADPVIDGLRVVGASTYVVVAADGRITYAYGHLLTASAGRRYPIIGATDAYGQLPPRPVPAIACAVRPGTPLPCPTFPPPVITKVELGLTLAADDEGPLLVPAWLFTVQHDPAPTAAIAVEPSFIGAPPTPSAETIAPATAVPPAAPDAATVGPAREVATAPVKAASSSP